MDSTLLPADSAWIWLNRVPEVNCYLQFRQSFVPEREAPLTLCISAEGQYAVFLDGKYLPSTQYPDFPHYKSVQTVEIAPPFSGGTHTLEIQVHYPGADTSVSRKEPPGLRFAVRQGNRILAVSGSTTLARQMPGYRSGAIANITGQLGVGFSWEGGDAEPWRNAVVVEKPCDLVARPVPELQIGTCREARLVSQGIFFGHTSDLQQYAALAFRERWQMAKKPEEILPSEEGICLSAGEGDGIYLILDLGEETVGYLELDAVCPADTRVDVGFGEHLDDLRVRTDVGGRHFTVVWTAGTERRRFVHRFLRLGCRYLQLFFHSREVTVYRAGLQPVSYPVRAQGQFHSSDHLFNQIFAVSSNTLRCCLHEHYEDCPWREQALYAFDSRNQMLAGYYAFGEFRQPRANLRLLALSQREDGLLELCAPARVSVDIPSFSLIFLVALEEYCRYSGDIAFGREMMPVAAKILQIFHAHMDGGRMGNFPEPQYWNFYEWRPLLDGGSLDREENLTSSADCPLQLFYLLGLQRMERLCGYLNLPAPGLAEEIRMVTDGVEQFWDERAGAYASFLRQGQLLQYAELVQALALYTGACPPERRDSLCEKLLSGELIPVTLSASIFKYEALLRQSGRYAAQVFEEIAGKWGKMLYQGATTFWETEDGSDDFDRAGSLCHGWSSVPAYIFGAYLLGVWPEEPGKWEQHDTDLACLYRAEGELYPPDGMLTVVRSRK